jgi:hypothetical protein
MQRPDINLLELGSKVKALRGNPNQIPDASVIVPVNAQGDLDNVFRVISDVAQYNGNNCIEIVIVVNNYEEEEPPDVRRHTDLGLTVLMIPNVRREGEVVSFTARVPGVRAAASENAILFDADCKLVNATDLIDWFIRELNAGATLAYTHVDYFDLDPGFIVQLRVFIHHASRWVKRVIFRIPIARGSSYAVNRTIFLEAYDKDMLADELNVGPVVKAMGHKIAYTQARNLRVLTSGRMFKGGWVQLFKYFRYRLRYNLKMLPVGEDTRKRTDRHKAPVRKYVNNRPVD